MHLKLVTLVQGKTFCLLKEQMFSIIALDRALDAERRRQVVDVALPVGCRPLAAEHKNNVCNRSTAGTG